MSGCEPFSANFVYYICSLFFKKNMTIHKEGRNTILISIVLLGLLNLVMRRYLGGPEWLDPTILVLSILAFVFVLSFFRVPSRKVSFANADEIISPASGKVVVIEEVQESEYFKDKRIQLSIFMSPANVHVNKSPIPGEVKYLKYHPGDYLVAWHPKSSTENERFTTVIANEEMEVLVRQIAGKVARKIKNYLEEGERLLAGNEIGFIKFGSRVDLFLPLDAKINVNLNDKVVVGKTILAQINN